jgi:hypothetical protein
MNIKFKILCWAEDTFAFRAINGTQRQVSTDVIQ